MQPENKEARNTPKTRWWRIATITIISLLVIVVGLLTWLINDTDRTKKAVERLVSTLTDRPFHIYGEFDFTLGSEITVSASRIEWDNAAWSSQPTMLTVGKVQASINFQSILNPPFLITNVEASNVRLDFEWSPDNVSNWMLAKSDSPPKKEPQHPLPLLLDKADLKNVELHFKHPGLTEELIILVESAKQQQDENHNLVTAISAKFDGRKVDIQGHIGPFPELVIAGAVAFDFSATGANSSIRIKGDFDNLAELKDPDLEIEFKAPEIATVLDILNLPEVTHGKALLVGSLVSADEKFSGSLQGSIGEFNLDGAFEATSLQPLEHMSAHLNSQGPSARAAGNTVGIHGLPAEPYDLNIQLTDTEDGLAIEAASFKSSGAVITASGLIHEFPALANLDLDLQVNVENIANFDEILPGDDIPALPLSMQVSIRSNTEGDSDSLNIKGQLGQLDAQIDGLLTEDPGFIGSKFSFSAAVPDSKKLGATLGLPILKTVKMTLRGNAVITQRGIDLQTAGGVIGPHNYSVTGELPFNEKSPQLTFDATINGPDLADMVSIFAITDRVPAMAYKLGGKISFANNRLELRPISGKIGDNNVKVDGALVFGNPTPNIDLQITADGKNLGSVLQTQGIEGGPAEFYSVGGRLTLSDASIRISALDFRTSDDRLQGTITVGRQQNPGHINFDLSGSGADLQSLLPTIPGYTPAAVSFDMQATGEINDRQINISRLSARLGTAKLSLSGTLDLPPNLKATAVSFKASGPHLPDLGAATGFEPSDIAFDISATMGGTTNNIEMTDINITAGPSDMRGIFKLNMEDKPQIKLQLDSRVLNIQTLQKRFREQAEATAEDQPESTSKDRRLIPDAPIPVNFLNSFDATVKVHIDKLISQRLDLGQVSIDGTLLNGKLDIPNLSARTDKGSLQSEIHIHPDQGKTSVEVTVTAKNIVLVLGELDENMRKNHPGHDIDLHLTSRGDSYREMAAALNGYLWLRGGERQIKSADLGFLFGDFLSEVFSTINPITKKEPYQTLECDRVFFEIVDGVAQTSPAVFFRTDKLNMTAVGAVNLATEKIDFGIETSPRKGIGISAGDLLNPFIKISGTLANPRLALDPTGTLIEGGAAVATMGLTIVAKSMYKRWLGPRKPCEKLTEEAFNIRRKQDPNNVPSN
ncbi:MAG: AsmA family protein [Gammaproteobacteria bacterium]|nr:MAG: AsmA family protein [Gammaproteobacteria bacterium]